MLLGVGDTIYINPPTNTNNGYRLQVASTTDLPSLMGPQFPGIVPVRDYMSRVAELVFFPGITPNPQPVPSACNEISTRK